MRLKPEFGSVWYSRTAVDDFDDSMACDSPTSLDDPVGVLPGVFRTIEHAERKWKFTDASGIDQTVAGCLYSLDSNECTIKLSVYGLLRIPIEALCQTDRDYLEESTESVDHSPGPTRSTDRLHGVGATGYGNDLDGLDDDYIDGSGDKAAKRERLQHLQDW